VQSYFAVAKSEGATAAIGGEAARSGKLELGQYIEPTVYVGVTPSMRIFREEIFGPVLTVTPFDDEEQAIRLANEPIMDLLPAFGRPTPLELTASLLASRQGKFSSMEASPAMRRRWRIQEQRAWSREGFESLRDYTQLKRSSFQQMADRRIGWLSAAPDCSSSNALAGISAWGLLGLRPRGFGACDGMPRLTPLGECEGFVISVADPWEMPGSWPDLSPNR